MILQRRLYICSYFYVTMVILIFISIQQLFASSIEWKLIKGKHFLIYYMEDESFASQVSNSAENYYYKIAKDLGYTKRDDFWLWEKRVKIYIYSTREKFIRETGAPKWVGGKASYKRKEISTYISGQMFFNSVLPHELTHLFFIDLVGFKGEVPLWLKEGISQWEEKGRKEEALNRVLFFKKRNMLIPLDKLTQISTKDLKGRGNAEVFYAQSICLVGYLIETYGLEKFRKLFGQLRDGKKLNQALRFTYPDLISNISDFERYWINYLNMINK